MYQSTKKIARLQFITSDDAALSHLEQIRLVLDNGVNWVQLRAKNLSSTELLKLAEEAKEITEEYKSTLIINDNHLVAAMVNAEGLHIGKEDVAPNDARKFLLEQIIGGTANELKDIKRINDEVDYIGLGPLRFTSTKKKLADILGFEGYQSILKAVPNLKPVIAIGGVVVEDIDQLMKIGVHGIAVSGAIINDTNPAQKTKQFLKEIGKYESIKA
jgi:thiamine-phosphate pyrophosphorylase